MVLGVDWVLPSKEQAEGASAESEVKELRRANARFCHRDHCQAGAPGSYVRRPKTPSNL
ncbi:hypothetical protein CALVIDRAFT_542318 [Calocera viscosa TUFC12733]|uniref:Uncharacterized protein n=1 Tax=Calocera viscosa (strain TUFC12733) TaxID=1330018 RepID=A0A167GS70_CALVF|nr:hypothetical protein CALVIDRAFT_542318 [Calocera viscosa TUFC12733]